MVAATFRQTARGTPDHSALRAKDPIPHSARRNNSLPPSSSEEHFLNFAPTQTDTRAARRHWRPPPTATPPGRRRTTLRRAQRPPPPFCSAKPLFSPCHFRNPMKLSSREGSRVRCRAKFRFLMGGLRASRIEVCERSSPPVILPSRLPFPRHSSPLSLPPPWNPPSGDLRGCWKRGSADLTI